MDGTIGEEEANKMSVTPTSLNVFYSYVDTYEPLRNELERHLSLLKYESLNTPWHKRQITAGTNWTHVLDRHLNIASVMMEAIQRILPSFRYLSLSVYTGRVDYFTCLIEQ